MEYIKPLYYDDLDIKVSLGSLSISILYIRYESARPDWNVGNHFHSVYELHFIPSGTGTLWVGKDKYTIKPNTCYLTGPNIYHEQKTDKTNPMSEFVISFDINDYKKKKPKNENYDSRELELIISTYNSVGFWIGSDEYSNIDIFEKIFWELKNKHVGYCFNVQSLATQIIVNAARSCMQKKESLNTAPIKISDDRRRFILDFYFGECYKTLTFDELAFKLNVSRRQLNRIIKLHYNTTFKEKLLSVKIQNAIHLLENTGLTIDEIAECVGFSSSSYFFRVFKNFCGTTPKEYKSNKYN